MSRSLKVLRIAPGASLQDRGRPGYLGQGLSRGGAADVQALLEGAALLGQAADCAAIEMPGMGGEFEAGADLRIALTGAPMRASIDGTALAWNASHVLARGARLVIGPALRGVYGYLHVGGGIDGDCVLGSRSAHVAAGVGQLLQAGDALALGADPGGRVGMCFDADDRFGGGTVHVLRSMQTHLFEGEVLERFLGTAFRRDARANRMGVQLAFDGAPFRAEGQLDILSEVIVPGDIQMTGDGAPFVLMPECQTTGGYPRIATVLPADLPKVAQAPAGAPLNFRLLERAEGLARQHAWAEACAGLGRRLRPLLRDPHDIADLLTYQLVSGVVSATEGESGS